MAFEDRFHDLCWGVVDDAMAERRGGDFSGLRFVDGEGAVGSRAVDGLEKLALQGQHFRFQVH